MYYFANTGATEPEHNNTNYPLQVDTNRFAEDSIFPEKEKQLNRENNQCSQVLEVYRQQLLEKYGEADRHYLLTMIAQVGAVLVRYTNDQGITQTTRELRKQFAELTEIFHSLKHSPLPGVIRQQHKEVVTNVDACLMILKFR